MLIGKVSEVFARYSKALLLSDPNSLVAVSLSGVAPGSKLVKGEKGLSIILDQVPQQDLLREGQIVITSGLEPSIPAGLVVGEVEDIISEENDLFQQAVLKPLVNFSALQIVSIVLSPNEAL